MKAMLKESLYYSKILLFGEYGIIQDSMGLSIPYSDYNGQFLFDEKNSKSIKSNQQLSQFLLHLKDLEKNLSNNLSPADLLINKYNGEWKKNIKKIYEEEIF